MISIILDTNIIISAALSKNSTPDKVLNYAIDNALLLMSEETYQELHEKLHASKFDKYVSLEVRQLFLKKLRSVAKLIDIERKIAVCRDSKDDKFLEVAVNGFANFIVTGDKDLLVLHPFESVEILTAADFLKQHHINIA